MTTATLEPTVALDESQILTQEMSALSHGQGYVLSPPFAGGTCGWKSYDPNFFWSSCRCDARRGEVVIQLGQTRKARAWGRAESVLWHDLRVSTSGTYRIVVRANAGPITRIGLAGTSVRSFIGGVYGGASKGISSYQTQYLVYNVDLQAGRTYRLFCIGTVLINNYFPTWPLSYGEVICSFPQVSAIPLPYAAQDPFESHIESALEKGDDDEAIEALSKELAEADLFGPAQPE